MKEQHIVFIARLFRPFITFDGDELSGGAEPVEAPTVDQPDTPDVTPEATPGPDDVEVSTPTEPEAPETPEAETEDEQFTDLDVTALPPELQERAKSMQADYTRKTQALAERNVELNNAVSFVTDLVADEPNETMEAVFKTLAEKLGYDLEGDDADEGTDDTVDQPEDTRTDREKYVDDLIARDQAKAVEEAEAEAEAHLDTVESDITTGIIDLAKAEGITDLTEEEIDVVFHSVLALPPEEQGPAVSAAYTKYKAAVKADRARWVQSKKSTTAPSGPAAETAVNFNNEEERLAFTARAVEAAQKAHAGL